MKEPSTECTPSGSGQEKESLYWVEKSNPILETRNDMALHELRLFNIYLAHINPQDPSTRCVSLPLKKISRLLGKELNENAIKNVGKRCMRIYIDLVEFDKESKRRGEMKLRHMFRRFDVLRLGRGDWQVVIEADEEILPYLFEIKEMGYLKYQLWNILQLNSTVSMKLYELIKARSSFDVYQISLDNLKLRLGMTNNTTYRQYKFFKRDVLERCIPEINAKTDLIIRYEEVRGSGKGRPVQALRFYTRENPDRCCPPIQPQTLLPDLSNTPANPELPYAAEYQRVLPKEVAGSTAYHPEQIHQVLQSYMPDLQISQEITLLKLATGRFSLAKQLKRSKKETIRSYPKFYIGILRNMLEEQVQTGTLTNHKKKDTSKNSFHNFHQRKYDFDKLLKELGYS